MSKHLKFIYFFVFLSLLLSSCSSTQESPADFPKLSILQGFTTNTQTQINILRGKTQNLSYRYKALNSEAALPIIAESFSREDSLWTIDKILISDLKPGITYQLFISENNKLVERREFSSLDLNKSEPRIAVASCMYDKKAFEELQIKMWKNLEQQKPDLVFLIGDNVYADKKVKQKGLATPKEIWSRYVQTRNTFQFYKQKKLTPTLAIWDDHDFGANNSGRGYIYKDKSKKIFQTFYSQNYKNKKISFGPGLSYAFIAFNQQFVFLDNRSFRSPNNKSKKNIETHWGYQQEKWLLRVLKRTTKPSYIIQGDQFFGKYHDFESYERNHPHSFKKMMKKISLAKTKVIFVSGDRHLFELMEIKQPEWPYKTFEITSSGMHAKMYPGRWGKIPNPRQIHGIDQINHFVILKSQAIGPNLDIQLSVFSDKPQALYENNLSVK